MVLRCLFIIIFTLNFSAYGKDFNSDKLFGFITASDLYKNNQYRQSQQILEKYYKFDSKKTPIKVVKLAAVVSERLREGIKAYNLYSIIISRKFKSINNEVIRSYEENSNADDLPEDIPENLQSLYYKQFFIYSNFYMNQYRSHQQEKLKLLKSKIVMFSEVLIELEYKEDQVENMITQIENFESALLDKKLNSYFSIKVSLSTWRDIIQLVNTNTGKSTDILSTADGLSLCAGYKKENAFMILKTSLCYARANADVGRKDQEIDYFQDNVPVSIYSFSPQLLWKPYRGDTAIGLTLPVVYRTGDYTPVPGYKLENTQLTSLGYLVTFLWIFNPISVELQFGKLKKFSSSYWNLGLIYDF